MSSFFFSKAGAGDSHTASRDDVVWCRQQLRVDPVVHSVRSHREEEEGEFMSAATLN